MRRTLGRATARVREAVGYWWLEQTDGLRDRRRGRRPGRISTLLHRHGHGYADTAPRSPRPARRPRSAWRHRRWSFALATAADRFARAGSAVVRPFRWVGAVRTSSGRGVSTARPGAVHGIGSVGAASTGWLTAIGDTTDDLVTGLGATGRRDVGAGAVVGRATSLRTRRGRLLASPSRRGGAIAAVTGMVVAAAILGATRLPGEAPSAEQGAVTGGQADPSASKRGGAAQGPGLSRPGIHLSVSPLGSGDLEVVERVLLPEPITVLPLSAPPGPPEAFGLPRLVDLSVSADDQDLAIAGSTEIGKERELSLPRPATTIELRYRVENADAQSVTAPDGRATLAIRPAASAALDSQPAVVQVRGAVVHTLVCVDEPRERQLCGVPDGDGWHTEPVTADRSSVVALVDLPPA
ncbi:hypothetical protein [Nocardioides sp. GXQ0305]|uniref:hypothetical protein n=1 Tax=Nocardioides sp. GXQ0305 TaxID=3423912 RepID=UPI003D7D28DE